MGWASVDVEESGEDMIAWLRARNAVIDERIRWALDECAKEWRWFVINSTWFNPRPSPDSEIITKISKDSEGWVFEYGWRSYSGSPSAALSRLELRKKIMHPIFLAFLAQSINGQR